MKVTEAIVLVGGLGTRLRPVLEGLPKPLAPVAGRPFVAYVLDQLNAQGIARCILAAGYMHEKLQAAIGHDWSGMEIDYSIESEPLGTGGAIALAAGRLRGRSAHVTNGDTFLRFDLAGLEAVVAETGASIGMALATVADVGRYGAVEVKDRRAVRFVEKGGQGEGVINAGSYLLTPAAFAAFPPRASFSFEVGVLVPAVGKGQVAVLEQSAEFIDIGVPDDLRRAQLVLGSA